MKAKLTLAAVLGAISGIIAGFFTVGQRQVTLRSKKKHFQFSYKHLLSFLKIRR